jgi:molybdate transport system substrate-binding protein
MQIIVDAGDNGADPQSFASNTMAIVTPPGNPAGIETLADLDGTDFLLCDPSAPCGAVAAEILSNAGVDATPVSLEDKVTAVLSKVTLGEADAGLVYVSDAMGAGSDVEEIDIPTDVNVSTPYFIAPVKDTPNSEAATEWIDLVMSDDGQNVLANDGFGRPAS